MKGLNIGLWLCCVFLSLPLWGQGTTGNVIEGRVLDENGQGLAGAAVLLQNTYKGTTTDLQGRFRLGQLQAGTYQLQVSFIGYQPQVLTVNTGSSAGEIRLVLSTTLTEEVLITATRVPEIAPMAFQNIDRATIQAQNFGQDLPILLNFSPSVVTTSDAGAGVGYTGMRIRGSDATRVNVTINGIPLNDAESHGTFFVNMPDFASSVESIQIQRGVGSSTNGAAAFGATVDIQTNARRDTAYLALDNSYGAFNTWKHTLQVGSGLLHDRFTVDARLSRISSDGFIDRAFSDLRSFYVSGAYWGKNSSLRLNIFSGQEQTYQAWYGIPEAKLRNDAEGIEAFIVRNGLNAEQADNIRNANPRRYNSQLYDNETDNYQQDHYQLFYDHQFSQRWYGHLALHYTKGRGYYEQFRYNDRLSGYNIAPVVIGTETIERSDLIRRRWLDNDFYGTIFSVNYLAQRLNFTFGGGWNHYEGAHFGEVIWARFAGDSQIRDRYYDNDATKTDGHLFAKAVYQLNPKLMAFADIQWRQVGYNFVGKAVDDNLGAREVDQSVQLNFFNPKLGLTYRHEAHTFYGSWAVGNKEPNRNDFTESSAESRPLPETLHDFETGYRYQAQRFAASLNYYYMWYQNQLLLTGQVNDVGAYTRVNVPESYRTGIELELAWKPSRRWTLQGNATWSQNIIRNFREFVDDFDNGGQQVTEFARTTIAFSPTWVASAQVLYSPVKGLEIGWLHKYVSDQFLDNTQNRARKLDAFYTQDLRIRYHLPTRLIPEVQLGLLVNNITNTLYAPNGYTFAYIAGGERIDENFFYPMAGTNFLLSVGLRF